ncbi:MAG: hypothetical protein L0H83_04355, partial [Salinisphaera sp.]|nr:hypothetical protein [Salinisphaera sp.]
MKMAPTAAPDTATFGEFAALLGFRRSYVTQLRKDGRLVLDGAGRILVAATRERIAATADPSKAAVAQRHAANRAAPVTAPAAAGETPDDADAIRHRIEDATTAGMTYQAARAIKERYAAMAAKRDYEFSMQQLLNAEDVRQTVLGAITTLRSRMESMPDMLAPQAAALTDDGAIRALLSGHIEHALEETARELRAMAPEP